MIPDIKYTTSGDLQIAYQVVGDGPVDIALAFDWGSNIELVWEHPQTERFLRRFASYGRLIFFDMRGIGLSDPVENLPPLEEWMDDVRAVMDAVGSDRAALVGHGHAGQLCMLVAASYPDRVQALATVNSFARLTRAPGYRAGMPEGAQQAWINAIRATWGTTDPLHLRVLAPDLADDEFARAWWARVERAAGSPRRAVRKQQLAFQLDVRDVLEAIAVPTLVVQSAGNRFVIPAQGRYLAERIPGAQYLDLASGGHWPWTAPDANRFLDKLEEFLTGAPQAPGRDRVLATVAFTDIVESTAIAASMGDRRWRELLEVHDSVARREVEAARGRMIKSTGDGLLAIFDGPARAIRCVRAIEHGVATLGLHVRAGLHTGEIELLGDDVGGIAVAIAARLTSLASSDEVVVSSTVKDLVVGSGLRFEDRGIHRRPSLVSQRPLGNPQGASPPRLPYWQAPWQSGACHRSAEMPSPFSSCWGAGAPPSGRLWVPLLGGRSQSDARVGCMVWSTTASSSPVRVSRSTWSRSQVLKVAMVWAASWRRPRQGWPTPTPAWPGSVSEALRTAVRERRPIFQGADAVILLVTPPRITGSTDPYQLDDPILPVIPSP